MFINVHKEIVLAMLLVLGTMLTSKMKGNTIATNANLLTESFSDTEIANNATPMTIGTYSVKMIQNGSIIHTVEVQENVTDITNVTLEAQNGEGEVIYSTTGNLNALDMQKLPLGTHTIKIYNGQTLLNTHEVKS